MRVWCLRRRGLRWRSGGYKIRLSIYWRNRLAEISHSWWVLMGRAERFKCALDEIYKCIRRRESSPLNGASTSGLKMRLSLPLIYCCQYQKLSIKYMMLAFTKGAQSEAPYSVCVGKLKLLDQEQENLLCRLSPSCIYHRMRP